MRLATLIIALVLTMVTGLQSCAVAAGGELAADFSTAAEDQAEAEELAGAGAVGVFASLLWLIAAALVLSKPKVSMGFFGSAAVFWLIAGTAGFSDGFIWTVVSLVFVAMSWYGVRELATKAVPAFAGYPGQWAPPTQNPPPPVAVAPGWYPDPRGQGLRWWDGRQWTPHVSEGAGPYQPR